VLLEEGQYCFYPIAILKDSHMMALFGYFVGTDVKDLVIGVFGAYNCENNFLSALAQDLNGCSMLPIFDLVV
jgi:hypothetical protein